MGTAEKVLNLFCILVSTQVHKSLLLWLASMGSFRAELYLAVGESLHNVCCDNLFFGNRSFSLSDVTHHLEAYLCDTQNNVAGIEDLTEIHLGFCASF